LSKARPSPAPRRRIESRPAIEARRHLPQADIAPAPASSSKTPATQHQESLDAIRDSGSTLIYVLHTGKRSNGRTEDDGAEMTHLDLSELLRPTLVTELSQSMTRARVQQCRYFADADRVLILHNDPDPMRWRAAGCAISSAAPRRRRSSGRCRGDAPKPADGEHARHRVGRSPSSFAASIGLPRSTSSRTISAAFSIAPTW
jgi:hypothetical protein